MEAKLTVEQLTDQLAKDVESFISSADPDVRAIVVNDDVRAVQAKWQIDDLDVLNPDYLETLRQKKDREYGEHLRAKDKEIGPQFTPLREGIGQKIAEARRLLTESERVNPTLNPERYINAKLLDEITLDRAERWLKDHEDDEAAILRRYTDSDDRRDVAFVRLVEDRYGLSDQAPAESTVIPLPLRRAVRERQDKRIPAGLRTALDTLQRTEDAYKLARAEAFPTTENITRATSAVLRRAK